MEEKTMREVLNENAVTQAYRTFLSGKIKKAGSKKSFDPVRECYLYHIHYQYGEDSGLFTFYQETLY